MFIETRTKHTEVLGDIWTELNYMANSVIGQARNRRLHPSTISNPMLRQELHALQGAYHLACKVSGGIDTVPAELECKIRRAHEAVAEATAKR